MKKILIIGLISLLSVVLAYGFAYAAVSGRCDNCHTMHSSQSPAPAAWTDKGWVAGTTFGALLVSDCIGCHSSTTSTTIVGGTPIVYNIAAGITDPGTAQSWSAITTILAGGNFYYVATGPSHSKGHNVEGIVVIDTPLGNAPPGYLSTRDPATTKYTTGTRLACAGSYGCHGNRNVTGNYPGIKGAHHGASTPIDGSTTAKSYRFLGSAALTAYSVLGLEDPNWQQSASVGATNDHNEYKGATTQAVTNTISYLCGHCHGDFHATIGTGSPWLRHPTDTDVITKGGEYASYGLREDATTIAGIYILQAPVGYVTTPAAARGSVVAGDSPVTCISCHRAHGSNYADILRWDYSTMQAGGGGVTENYGCFTCHTTKD